MRATTLFPLYSADNLFGVSFRYFLNCLSYFFVLIMGAEVYGVSDVRVTISFPMWYNEKFRDAYLCILHKLL